ncbi:MAG: hypothetical protein GC203_04540 [Phenylobacterium sp.]|uniref:hypothetical protein n=1 Tax=Phenylobacterium sp. TaxID=1871053 RepID=UPI0025F659E9|nr:hypothetical protein [Phenylobacterium sp.]MBI1197112.1 hypothetical protein [Phenylobacterium sp.]
MDRAEARGQAALADQINAALVAKSRGAPIRALGSPAPVPDDDWADDEDADQAFEGDAGVRRRSRRPLLALGGGFAAGALAWTLSGLQPMQVSPPPPRPAPAARAMLARYEPAPSTTPAPPSPAKLAPTPAPDVAPASPPAESAPIRKVDRCAGLATRGERLVCGDPQLSAQHRRLQQAYVRALNSRADPQVVDGGQAAFRLALSRAEDPERLAQLLDSRIRELNAAAAAAQAGRSPN